MRTSTETLQELQSLTEEAIDVIRHLLRDPATPPSVRLDAAKLILFVAIGGGDDEPSARPTGPHLVPRARTEPERVA